MRIGSRTLRNNLFVAPMAGVTDRPFRQLCKKFGAGLAVSEMVASNSLLWGSEKTRRRANHEGEVDPISVQIAGADPVMMAEAARFNVERGAQIVDINMGCPAKKVCNTLAGSALLKDEPLVARILKAVVNAVNVPVTLKFRTGWDPVNKNALKVAKIAEDSGVQLLSLHGRTRACGFSARPANPQARVRPCRDKSCTPLSSAIFATFRAFLLTGSHPVRNLSVTGTVTAFTTALRMRATRGSSLSSADPARVLQTFFAGQPMLMSTICAPRSTLKRAASAIMTGSAPAIGTEFEATISDTARPAPNFLHSCRKGRSVTPAIGATKRLLRNVR